MTRRLIFVLAALFLVVAACGDGVEENGGVDPEVPVDTKPDNTATTDGGGATTTAPDAGGNEAVPPGQDPRNILGGEGAEEDAAALSCFEGDLAACDELFAITDVDSDLETYAQTCGGRIEEQDGAPECLDQFPGAVEGGEAQQPGDLTDDPELADSTPEDIARFGDLADECFGGDLGACDELFLSTPIDSDFEAYGSTCGGRLDTGVSGSCENQLGSGSTDTTTSTN